MAYYGVKRSRVCDVEPLFPITIWTGKPSVTASKRIDNEVIAELSSVSISDASILEPSLRNTDSDEYMKRQSREKWAKAFSVWDFHSEGFLENQRYDESNRFQLSSNTKADLNGNDWKAVKRETSAKSNLALPVKYVTHSDYVYEWLKASVTCKDNIIHPELMRLTYTGMKSDGRSGDMVNKMCHPTPAMLQLRVKWDVALKKCYMHLNEMCSLCKGFQSASGYVFDALPELESFSIAVEVVEAVVKLCCDVGGVLEYVMNRFKASIHDLPPEQPEYANGMGFKGENYSGGKSLSMLIGETLRALLAYNRFLRVMYPLMETLMGCADLNGSDHTEIETVIALVNHLETLLHQARCFVTVTFERIWNDITSPLRQKNGHVFSNPSVAQSSEANSVAKGYCARPKPRNFGFQRF